MKAISIRQPRDIAHSLITFTRAAESLARPKLLIASKLQIPRGSPARLAWFCKMRDRFRLCHIADSLGFSACRVISCWHDRNRARRNKNCFNHWKKKKGVLFLLDSNIPDGIIIIVGWSNGSLARLIIWNVRVQISPPLPKLDLPAGRTLGGYRSCAKAGRVF